MNIAIPGRVTTRHYNPFEGQLMLGQWRIGKTVADITPLEGSAIAEIVLASDGGLDGALVAAAKAQLARARALLGDRNAVSFCATAIMDARHEEIAMWRTHEPGS